MATPSQAAGVAVFIFIVIAQTPLFLIQQPAGPLKHTPSGYRVKAVPVMVPLSPMQGACISILTLNPALLSFTKGLLLPGTFYRVLTAEFSACVSGAKCAPGALLDFPSLLADSDVSKVMPAFNHSFKLDMGWAQTACGLVVISAFMLLLSPGKGMMGGVGMVMLFYCLMVHKDTTEMQAPLLLIALLAGYAAWEETADSRAKTKASKAKSGAKATATPAVAGGTKTPLGGKVTAKAATQKPSGSSKKKSRA